MIKPEMVPDEAWHALKRFVLERPYGYDYREAIAAALNAWPGAFRNDMEEAAGVRRRIILPLPTQENGDD